MTGGTTKITSEELLAVILKSLDDDKAEEVVQIDLRGKSSIGDYMVIASGRSSRQVSSIAVNPFGVQIVLKRVDSESFINAMLML